MLYNRTWKTLALWLGVMGLTIVMAACGGQSPAAAPQAPAATNTPEVKPTDTPVAASTTATDTTSTTTAATNTVTTTQTATTTQPTTSTQTATTTTTATTTQAAGQASAMRVFAIDQSKSEARFTLNEKLMGSPKTVVGVTPLVDGKIQIDLADPTKATISPIQIDARDFKTDSNMRNGAIRRFILQTNNDANRYIVFTPKAIEGLPQSAKAGDTLALKISGDLTISGVTKPVTFDATVKAVSDQELEGLAKTQVLRSDFNLQIPSVPSVADVTDEVQLELQFAAKAE